MTHSHFSGTRLKSVWAWNVYSVRMLLREGQKLLQTSTAGMGLLPNDSQCSLEVVSCSACWYTYTCDETRWHMTIYNQQIRSTQKSTQHKNTPISTSWNQSRTFKDATHTPGVMTWAHTPPGMSLVIYEEHSGHSAFKRSERLCVFRPRYINNPQE